MWGTTGAISTAGVLEPLPSTAFTASPSPLAPLLLLLAGNEVVCGLQIVNSGNVGLNDTTVTGQAVDCPPVPQLAPGQVHHCNISRTLPQEEFDAWDANGTRIALAVDITALPTGAVATGQISNHTNGTTTLVSRPSFNVTSADVVPVEVLNAGEPVAPLTGPGGVLEGVRVRSGTQVEPSCSFCQRNLHVETAQTEA